MENTKIDLIRENLGKWRVDGLLITNAANRRWLTGFTGSAGMVLVTPQKAILATDSRYWEQAERQSPDFEIYRSRPTKEDMNNFLTLGGVNRIGFEAKFVSVADFRAFKRLDGFRWRGLATTVEPFRAIKTAEELAKIETAARITDDTVAQFPRLAIPGVTEKAIAWELEKYMRDQGADKPGFDIIVASGGNSALPHHHPDDRQLQRGDIIVVDLGAEVNGYRADLTRTFFLGDSPDGKFQDIFSIVHRAQLAAIDAIRAGVNGKFVDAQAREVIKDAGHGDHFGHGTGHSLGLEIHESPRFSVNSEREIIQAGTVMTVEPGIYLPGYGGVRIEDLVLVTDSGAVYLSHAPKEPFIKI